MKKNEFDIKLMRKYFDKADKLYIEGVYSISADETESKLCVFADGQELDIRMIEEIEKSDSGNKRKRWIKMVVDISSTASYGQLRFCLKSQKKTWTMERISLSTIARIMDQSDYNVDVLKKNNDGVIIKGWIIYKENAKVLLKNEKNETMETEVTYSTRDDIKLENPEMAEAWNVTGFVIHCDAWEDKYVKLVLSIDEEEKKLVLSQSDFEKRQGILSILKKRIKEKGIKKTLGEILERIQKPLKLARKISDKTGFTVVLRRLKRSIKEEYVAKTQYANLTKLYPFATKKMIYMEVLDELKGTMSGDVKFSIVVPLFNTPTRFLREMIESVQIQTYTNWELCLADGSDIKHTYVQRICTKYSKKDSRIKYKKLDKNYGISGNTNECLKMTTGNFIGLFDHDDFLHPMVLEKCYVKIRDEEADFVYTDEATFVGELENIVTYHFKADYGIDSLRANNYFCHFSTFSKSVLDEAGWYNSEYDGSQDHDLILRLAEKAKNIQHIPEVLYFWRSHPGSVAEDISAKTYAIEAGIKAVEASIKRSDMTAKVTSSEIFPTIYRIKYDLLDTPLVSIIIPNCNHLDDLKRCIQSIQRTTSYKNYEIIVIENNSNEQEIFDYYKEIEGVSNVRILEWKDKFNYAAINNYAVKHANGKFLLFLNNDIEVITAEWIEEMLMYAQRPDVAAVGAKLYYPDNTIQHAGIVLGMGKHRVAGHAHYKCAKNNWGYMGRLYYAHNVSAVTAACLLMRKSIFEKVGGFDENFVVAYNDVDLCVKSMQQGYVNVFTPYAELYHFESASRGEEDTPEKKKRLELEAEMFRNKWKTLLEKGDPYFNKNFSLDSPLFEIDTKKMFKERV